MLEDVVAVPERCISAAHQILSSGILERELTPWIELKTKDKRKRLLFRGALALIDANYLYRKQGKLCKLEGILSGKRISGSYGMHQIARLRFEEDESLFEPEKMARMTLKKFEDFFRDDEGNFYFSKQSKELTKLRASFWRDWGRKLMRYFKGDPRGIFKLRRIEDYLLKLDLFDGFQGDYPCNKKKHNYIARAEEGKEIAPPLDPYNRNALIDYVVSKVALRIGLVNVLSPGLKEKLQTHANLSFGEMQSLRIAVHRAINCFVKSELFKYNPDTNMYKVDQWFFGKGPICRDFETSCKRCDASQICARQIDYLTPGTYSTLLI
jgi:hypothetical protein